MKFFLHSKKTVSPLFQRGLADSSQVSQRCKGLQDLQTFTSLKSQGIYLLLVFLILLSGCQSTPNEAPRPSVSAASPAPSPTVQSARKAVNKPKTPDKNTLPVTLYQLDNQCNKFVPQKVRVSKTKTLEKTIGRVLEDLDNDDFSLSGYRVNVKKGVATIDFRIASGAKRQLKSLSNCEQLALYGSLRKTLTGNKVLKIKSVQFTDRGQKLKP